MLKLTSAAILACFTAAIAGAQQTPSPALLVLAKSDHTLSIVDPGSMKVVARPGSGQNPHEVIASADGRTAYISNYGGGAYNTLTVVDLVNQKTVRTIDLGALRGPHGLAVAGGKVWFTAEAAKAIGSYDPTSNKIDLILGTGQDGTHMIHVSDDLTRMVTTNIGSGTVTLFEKTTGGGGRVPGGNWRETVVPVGRRAEGFDVAPDGKEAWIANAQDGTISIIDLSKKAVTQTLQANVRGANRLKFTPNGKLVFVTSLSAPDVAIFDASTRKEMKRVKVGSGAAGLVMQPDGARAFVACSPDDYVAIIDLNRLEVTGHLDAGKQPDGLAWAVLK